MDLKRYLNLVNERNVTDSEIVVENCSKINSKMKGIFVVISKFDLNDIEYGIRRMGGIEAEHCANLFAQMPSEALKFVIRKEGKSHFLDYFLESFKNEDAILKFVNSEETGGLPEDRKGLPEDRKGLPEDRKGLPEDRKGLPEDNRGSKSSPHNVGKRFTANGKVEFNQGSSYRGGTRLDTGIRYQSLGKGHYAMKISDLVKKKKREHKDDSSQDSDSADAGYVKMVNKKFIAGFSEFETIANLEKNFKSEPSFGTCGAATESSSTTTCGSVRELPVELVEVKSEIKRLVEQTSKLSNEVSERFNTVNESPKSSVDLSDLRSEISYLKDSVKTLTKQDKNTTLDSEEISISFQEVISELEKNRELLLSNLDKLNNLENELQKQRDSIDDVTGRLDSLLDEKSERLLELDMF